MLREDFESRFFELGFTMEQIDRLEQYGWKLTDEEEIEDPDDCDARELALQYMFDNMIDQSEEKCRKYLIEEIGLNCSSRVIRNVINRMEMDW